MFRKGHNHDPLVILAPGVIIFVVFEVIPPGFEPGTHSLEGCCSIQLSYGTVNLAQIYKKKSKTIYLSLYTEQF